MYMMIGKKQTLTVLAAALVLCFGLLLFREPADAALPAASWGLSFQTEGETPVGNAEESYLRQYNAFFTGQKENAAGQKLLYLTFDAGYENGNTAAILDALKKHNAPATFFVVGNFAESEPELIRRMAEEGHVIGNHTDTHPDMAQIADEAGFAAELTRLEEKVQAVTGQPMEKYYRPPRGVYSEENLRMAQKLGYTTLFWSLAYVDWYVDDQPTAEEAFAKLLPRVHPGAVVLLHTTSATNAAILDELLTRWEEMGYTFASVREIA